MKLFAAISLALSATAFAVPTATAPKPPTITAYSTVGHDQRVADAGEGTASFCINFDYEGTCTTVNYLTGQCYSFAPGDSWDKAVSTFSPSEDSICFLWSSYQCPGAYNLLLTYPGSGNLGDQGFNDELASFTCYSTGA